MELTNRKRKTAFIMSGIPGSGKSTWIRENMNPDVDAHISRDNIRFALLKEDDLYFAAEQKVRDYFFQQIQESTNTEYTDDCIFIDATHLTPKSRKATLRHINKHCYTIAVDFKVNLTTALSRNAGRTGRALVPNDVICRMYGQYIPPSLVSESFDEVWHIDDNGKITKEISLEQ